MVQLSFSHRFFFSQGQLQRSCSTTLPSISRPIYHYFQHQGISSSTWLLANASEEISALLPLAPVSLLSGLKGEDQKQKAVTMPEKVQAVLKGIKQHGLDEVLNIQPYIKGLFDKLKNSTTKF
ncbi:hypothetical protein VNO77_13670 [Canavalia gladiata]|uniref:Uncharacterized protein n=1 Tax=Canavalia gladiata TaxID=3824 RepID=A0AAN9M162_CANGL